MTKDLLFQDQPHTHRKSEPSMGMGASERLPVLAARPAASQLQDETLNYLFRSCRVELFAQPFDLFVIRTSQVSCALLCASPDCPTLAAEAFIIRKQWPRARIIVVGNVPHDLQDHLYDVAVAANCDAANLANAFISRSIDLWNKRLDRVPDGLRWLQTPAESDPTKAHPQDLLPTGGQNARDLPAEERLAIYRAVIA
jgi:hypothetical protein